MDKKDLSDRQFEALLGRLDAITIELARLNRRQEAEEGLLRVAAELRSLSESLQALAYAALGASGPSVRRRRAG